LQKLLFFAILKAFIFKVIFSLKKVPKMHKNQNAEPLDVLK